MKHSLETRGARLKAPLLWVLISIVGIAETACVSRPTAPVQASNQDVTEPARHVDPPTGIAPKKLVECLPFGSFPEPTTVQTKGEHIVILSWNASAPADANHAAANGYCVYRSTERKDQSFVRVNTVPFQGTSCTDDLVETGKTYYYRVKAISAKGKTSDATRFATAPIKDRKPAHPFASPPPPCREPAIVK
jgi:hypothetical protein